MSTQKIPLWIKIFGGLLATFGIVVAGVMMYGNPASVVPNFVSESVPDQHAVMMLAGRNIAMGIAMVVALLSGRAGWLVPVFAMRAVAELSDIVTTVVTGNSAMGVGPTVVMLLVFLVPELLAIWKLRSMTASEA